MWNRYSHSTVPTVFHVAAVFHPYDIGIQVPCARESEWIGSGSCAGSLTKTLLRPSPQLNERVRVRSSLQNEHVQRTPYRISGGHPAVSSNGGRCVQRSGSYVTVARGYISVEIVLKLQKWTQPRSTEVLMIKKWLTTIESRKGTINRQLFSFSFELSPSSRPFSALYTIRPASEKRNNSVGNS